MNVLITGASGFLGQYVVAELLKRGHHVHAVIRPASDLARLPWQAHAAVTLVRLDLDDVNAVQRALSGMDAVVHLAAAKSGNYAVQYASTVAATAGLTQAMAASGVTRLIAIGTFSVYDYLKLPEGSMVTETAPIESHPMRRDIYAQTKLLQDQIFHEFEQTQAGQVTLLRPGMIYGRDHLWNACLGSVVKNKFWVRIGADAEMPLIYVENCAAAIALALESPEAIGKTLNLVDDHLPTQTQYARELAQRMPSPPPTIVIPWALMRWLANTVNGLNQGLFRGALKLPGLLIPARLHARFKPLRYSNDRAKQCLHWEPHYSLTAAFDRSCSQENLLNVPASTKPVSSI